MLRLKRYRAPSMEEAHARIREECGSEIEMVSSRTLRSPGLFGAPPQEYVEVVVRVSDEELERRAKLTARLAAARAEAAAARATEMARSAERDRLRALEPPEAEETPADDYADGYREATTVFDAYKDEAAASLDAYKDEVPVLFDAYGAEAPELFDAYIANGAVADELTQPDFTGTADGPFDAFNARRHPEPTIVARDEPRAAPAPAAAAALLTDLTDQMAEIRSMLRQFAVDRLGERIDGAPDAVASARSRLLEQGVAPAIIAPVLEETAQSTTHPTDQQLLFRTVERKLAAQLPAVARVDFARRPVVIFLVGPSGAGKTTMAMRLALDIRAHSLTAAVAGIDVSRAGAPQQLTALGSASGVPTRVCYAPGELQAMIGEAATDVIIVDTAGHTGARRDRMTELQAFLQAARRRQILLVLPATMKVADLTAVTKAYEPIGVAGLVLTRCDETTTFGSLVTTAVESGLGITYTAHSDAVGQAPRGGDNLMIARAVMSGEWPELAAAAEPRARTATRAS